MPRKRPGRPTRKPATHFEQIPVADVKAASGGVPSKAVKHVTRRTASGR